MQLKIWRLYCGWQNILRSDEGQDLIEYALVVALIAFAATAGMGTLAKNINAAYTTIGSKITAKIT